MKKLITAILILSSFGLKAQTLTTKRYVMGQDSILLVAVTRRIDSAIIAIKTLTDMNRVFVQQIGSLQASNTIVMAQNASYQKQLIDYGIRMDTSFTSIVVKLPLFVDKGLNRTDTLGIMTTQ